jgi:hypothetical protein
MVAHCSSLYFHRRACRDQSDGDRFMTARRLPRVLWVLILGGVLPGWAGSMVPGRAVEARQAPVPAAPAADHIQSLAPGTRYDPRIPTLKAVTGHDFGEEITPPPEIVAYLRALHAAAPDRTALVEYARSWEGRPLHALVIGSPERMAKLDAIKADLRRLADPRGLSAAEAERLVSELPAVTALLHGVHGNEISSAGAAMAEAYHLLAAQGDPVVDLVLRESIVIIDPAQNPDGRARFVFQTRLGRAATPDPEPLAAEHDEPWPGGRSNHYLFDLNRDWFAQTQPETRGKVALLLEWMPHVVVDLHEMGGESTYYFPPSAPPGNPWMTDTQKGWLETFGRANAARFDARGFPYFIREVYDSFYPGYGVSWPMAQGAIGMTFEKASARGLVYRRADGTLLTYLDGIREHFTAAISTAETAARHRAKLLADFLEFRRSAVRMGEQGAVREYVLAREPEPARADRLARLLAMNGIEVRRATAPFKAAGRSFPAGTYLVPLAQPAARLARNLLDAHTGMDEGFLKIQDERRKRRLPDQIYDVTAWSLPLLWDVDVTTLEQPSGAPSERVAAAEAAAAEGPALPPAKVAYLLPWGVSTAAVVAEALQQGTKVRVAGAAFTLAGRQYPVGTAIVRTSDNGAEVGGRLGPIVARHGAVATAADSGFVEEGISLGSGQVRALKAPRVLLAWDGPASSLSAGWARYVLERRYGQPVTAVRVGSLGRVDLARWDVVVLPSGSYTPQIGADFLRRLKDWVSAGGTIITLGEASRWAAREQVGLLQTHTELRGGRPDTGEPPKPKTEAPKQPINLDEAITPPAEPPELVPGAILRVKLDLEHWLASGSDGEIGVMVESQRVFAPITLDKGRNVGVYQTGDRLVASGVVWPESRTQLPSKAYLIHQPMGQGHVIAFAEDPNPRAFAEASQLLFITAVLMGPAF